MGTVIDFPGRLEGPINSPRLGLVLDYFAMRVTQLEPGSPDRLRVEALLGRADRLGWRIEED